MLSVWKHWPHIGTHTDEQLRGTGCLIAIEQKIFTLNDVAKPLTNFKEMMAAATRRNMYCNTIELLKKEASTSADV